MASKFVIFAIAMAVASAKPFTITADNYYPNGAFETPKIAYGFGSGFSSDFGGIKYSNGVGSSFQFGGGQAYGAGYGSNEDGTSAGGVGSAITRGNNVIYYPVQSTYQTPTILTGDSNPRYAISSAQNNGGSGAAFAQSQTGANYGTAFSTAQNQRGAAISSATNTGYGASISRADNLGYGNSIATAHTLGQGSAISAAHNYGDQRLSTAQTIGTGGQTAATSFNAPGYQIAQSHAFRY